MTDPRTLAHTPNARALAHEILRQDIIPPLCTRDISNGHSQMCDRITSALRTARKEAYERAALAIEEYNLGLSTKPKMVCCDCVQHAADLVRKLGDDNG